MNRLEAVVIIKINLELAANPCVQNEWAQDSRGKANTAAIDTVREHGLGTSLIQPLEFFGRNGQIYDNTFQPLT